MWFMALVGWRAAAGGRFPPVAVRGRPAGAPCQQVTAGSPGFFDDKLHALPAGTLRARTTVATIRLMPDSSLLLKNRQTLSAPTLFLLDVGQLLVSHTPGQDIIVQTKNTLTQPLDTEFSVRVDQKGNVKVAVWDGSRGAVVTSTMTGDRVHLSARDEVRVSAAGEMGATAPVDAETERVWNTYGLDSSLDVAELVRDPQAPCRVPNTIYPTMPAAVQDRLLCPVAAATGYSAASKTPGSITAYAGGELVYDGLEATLLAVDTADHTWQSFSYPSASPDSFLAAYPDVQTALGTFRGACPAATWSVQRFGGGVVVGPHRAGGCTAPMRDGVVLYQDGTWIDGPDPATPAPTPQP